MTWITVTLVVVTLTWVLIHTMGFLLATGYSWLETFGWKRYNLVASSDIEIPQRSPERFRTEIYFSHRAKIVRGLLYGMISGILSAHTLLLAKSVVELLVRTLLQGSNQFQDLGSWVLLLFMVTLALVQLYFLHCGLKLCSTSVLYPFVFCIYNVIAILDGLIYFSESADKLTVSDGAAIAIGTVILLVGVAFLSWKLDREERCSAAIENDDLYPADRTSSGSGALASARRHCTGIIEPVCDEHRPLLGHNYLESFHSTRQHGLSNEADSYGTCPKTSTDQRK